jgi:hypothetical protein
MGRKGRVRVEPSPWWNRRILTTREGEEGRKGGWRGKEGNRKGRLWRGRDDKKREEKEKM